MIHVEEIYLDDGVVLLGGRTTGSHLGLARLDGFRGSVIWAARIRDDRSSEWHVLLDDAEARRCWGINRSTRLA